MGITRVTIWVIGASNLLTKSPRPSKQGPDSHEAFHHQQPGDQQMLGTQAFDSLPGLGAS